MPFIDPPDEVTAREPGLLLPDPAKAAAPGTTMGTLDVASVGARVMSGLPGVASLAVEALSDTGRKAIGHAASIYSAAAQQENMLVSAYNYMSERSGFKDDPDHNPLDVIGGTKYEADLKPFVGSRSEAETRSIMARIDREEANNRLLDAAGWGGTVARVVTGVLDPTLMMPGAAVYRGTKAAATIGRTALGVGLAATGQAALTEGALYATQETRTPGEVASNIGGAAILGGILGAAIGGLTAKEVASATRAINDVRAGIDREMSTGRPQPAGAASAVTQPLTLEPAFGLEKGLKHLSPITRLQQSPFDTAKATVRDMADSGLSYRENWEGIPTSEGGTIETRVKMHNGPLYGTIAQMDDAYARYFFGREDVSAFERRTAPLRAGWARLTGNDGGKLTFQEFREEIGKAMARGDQHPIPQVAEAAQAFRSKVVDPMWKRAVELKIADDVGEVVGAQSYITRIYNREMIVGRRDEWSNILETHFREQVAAHKTALTRDGKELDSFAQMDDNAIKELVTSVTNKILGESAQRLASLSFGGKDANPLAKRVLTVPDEKLEPFLIRDIEKVMRAYTRSLAPDIEITAKFGDVTMKEQLAKLQDEYNAKTEGVTGPAAKALKDQYVRAAADIGATRDRLRNMYKVPDNPDGMLYRAGKMALNLNYLARLGGMTISAVPDLARPIMRYGIGAFRDGWLPLVTNFSEFKMLASEVKLTGTALDMVRDQRLLDIADIMDDFGRHSRFERGVQALTDKFGIVSLMSPWNGALKQMTGVITIGHVMRAVKAVSEGKASTKQVNRLAQAGIDDAMAKRIWAQSVDSGTDVRGVHLPNTEDWKDLGAVEAFRAAIVREVDNLIVTPGLEKPLWMSTGWGRIMGQFKSFAMVSTQRTLMAGLQQRDAAALTGVMTSLALGALTAKIKATQRGEDTSTWQPGRWAAEAIDNSGLGGVLVEGANIADKWTGGKVGLARLGVKEVSRYQSRNAPGSLMGPTFDAAIDAAQVTRAISSGEVARSDLHALRQITPFQNLFYLRRLFDKVEESIGDRMQLPAKRERN